MPGFLPPLFLRPNTGHASSSAQKPSVTPYHQHNKNEPLNLTWQTLYNLAPACFSSFDPLDTIP